MTATMAADPSLDKLLEAMGLNKDVPALTPIMWWSRVLMTSTSTIYDWIEQGFFPQPVLRSKRKTLFSTRQVLEHLARQQGGRSDGI